MEYLDKYYSGHKFSSYKLTRRSLIKLLNGFASQFKPKPTRRKKTPEYPFYPDGPEGDGKQNQNNRG